MKARKVKGLDPAAPLADNLERTVKVRCAELHSFMPRAADPAAARRLHDMRIAAKRLRYVLELSDGCFGPYAATAVKRVKELQDLLGEVHDCDITLPRVEELIEETRARDAAAVAARAAGAEDLTPGGAADAPHAAVYRGLETLATYLRARRAVLFARFGEDWQRLERDGFRARLEYAVGERPAAEDGQPAPALDALTVLSHADNDGAPSHDLASPEST